MACEHYSRAEHKTDEECTRNNREIAVHNHNERRAQYAQRTGAEGAPVLTKKETKRNTNKYDYEIRLIIMTFINVSNQRARDGRTSAFQTVDFSLYVRFRETM